MSYINDALQKVQKEKESPYASYGDVVLAQGKKTKARKKWFLIAGLLLIFFFAAGIIALLYWPDIRETPQTTVAIVQNPGVATAQPVQNMSPALVPETPALEPAVPVEVAAPLPAKIEKAPAADKPLTAEVKEKKQNAVIPKNTMKQEAAQQPVVADPASLYKQALQKQHEGRLEEARELYQKVIKMKPHHIQALNNLGVVYLKLKRYKWAIICFNDAIDIKHNYVDAHYNLACLYAQKNDTKQSMFYLKNAVDFNPEVRQWAIQDDDLKSLADLPEFNKILQARDK